MKYGSSTLLLLLVAVDALTPSFLSSRRAILGAIGGACAGCVAAPYQAANAAEGVDVDSFMRTGMVSQPMGVSGQAGKSKPETGIVLRDGSEISRDSRSGSVLAEIVVKGAENKELMAVVASFSAPWPLATGTVYDVECRDANTGDGVFLAVSPDVGGKTLVDLKDSFFTKSLFKPTGRFSFYGQPTDVKVKKSEMIKGDSYKVFDVSFATLSQSTQTELPRKARVIVTIPRGSSQAVMLVGSASALRWKKGSETTLASITDSFQAVAAPKTSMKIRAKQDRDSLLE